MGTARSLLHREHQWIGQEVEDTAIGRRGILRVIAPDGDRPRRAPGPRHGPSPAPFPLPRRTAWWAW
ncbi:hypothetical protein [Streptomyces olivaceus]|uniref:hypothetical protein n=1 Tax=Streptomyces olivaceus TaxID=47716 RepID=UPI0036473442